MCGETYCLLCKTIAGNCVLRCVFGISDKVIKLNDLVKLRGFTAGVGDALSSLSDTV